MADRYAGRDDARDAESLEMFLAYKVSGDISLRNELVVRHTGVAEALARRFAGRGEPLEDLEQVAQFALVRGSNGSILNEGSPSSGSRSRRCWVS